MFELCMAMNYVIINKPRIYIGRKTKKYLSFRLIKDTVRKMHCQTIASIYMSVNFGTNIISGRAEQDDTRGSRDEDKCMLHKKPDVCRALYEREQFKGKIGILIHKCTVI